MKDLRYPIGQFKPEPFSATAKDKWVNDIKNLPEELEAAVHNLTEAQLNTPYREGGWTLNQVVHHLTDSHMNSFITFKLGLTENNPTALPYNEKSFATLADVIQVAPGISVNIVHYLCYRWYTLLQNMSEGDFNRTIVHPELGGKMNLWTFWGMCVWHGKHHIAHITSLREEKKW